MTRNSLAEASCAGGPPTGGETALPPHERACWVDDASGMPIVRLSRELEDSEETVPAVGEQIVGSGCSPCGEESRDSPELVAAIAELRDLVKDWRAQSAVGSARAPLRSEDGAAGDGGSGAPVGGGTSLSREDDGCAARVEALELRIESLEQQFARGLEQWRAERVDDFERFCRRWEERVAHLESKCDELANRGASAPEGVGGAEPAAGAALRYAPATGAARQVGSVALSSAASPAPAYATAEREPELQDAPDKWSVGAGAADAVGEPAVFAAGWGQSPSGKGTVPASADGVPEPPSSIEEGASGGSLELEGADGELQEKLRRAEVELSLERARLARERAELEMQKAQVEREREQLRSLGQFGEAAAPGGEGEHAKPGLARRWLRVFGKKGAGEAQ